MDAYELESQIFNNPSKESNRLQRGDDFGNSPDESFADVITQTQEELTIDYPEGGRTAFLTLFGCFLGLIAFFGLWNTIGAIESYVSKHILVNDSEIAISMIFSIYAFFTMFGTLITGVIFDRYGARKLLLTGTILTTAGLLSTANCTTLVEFIFAFGVLCGIGCSCFSAPFITSVGHFFNKRRGFAISIAMPGGSLGGVIWPLLCRSLYVRVGFVWAIRTLALCIGTLLFIGTLCVSDRHEEIIKVKMQNEGKTELTYKDTIKELIDFKSFKDTTFMVLTFALFLSEFALLMVGTYIPAYALSKGFSESFSLLALTIFNASGIAGRFVPAFLSDRYGNFNLIILMSAIMSISVWVLWLPFGKYKPAFTLFTIIFGFGVAGVMSLTSLCTSAISKPKDYGKRYGTVYFCIAFSNLITLPISMALTETSAGYDALVAFGGATCTLATIFFVYTRYRIGGFNKISI